MEVQRDWIDYVDVFGGLVVGILTFGLGYALSSFIERGKIKRDQKECRNYFNIYWNEQVAKADRQIELMADFADQLKVYASFDGIQITKQIHPFFLYDAMDKQKLVESFRVEGKHEMIIQRMTFVEVLRYILDEYSLGYEKFAGTNKNLGQNWNDSMEEFYNMKLQITASSIETLSHIPEVVEIHDRYNGLKSDTVKDAMEDMVYPLYKYLGERYSKNPNNQYAMAFLPILAKLMTAYEHIIAHSNSFSYEIEDLTKALKERLEFARIDFI